MKIGLPERHSTQTLPSLQANRTPEKKTDLKNQELKRGQALIYRLQYVCVLVQY